MKKLTLALTLVAATVSTVFAGPTKVDFKTTIHCAVMKNEVVKIADATKKHMYADYKGRRYFFCCNGCPQSFKKDPKKYAKNDSIPIPKAKK